MMTPAIWLLLLWNNLHAPAHVGPSKLKIFSFISVCSSDFLYWEPIGIERIKVQVTTASIASCKNYCHVLQIALSEFYTPVSCGNQA